MLQYRTDLAMEAHELLCAKSRAQTLSGVDSRTVFRRGCSVTSVRIDTEGAARQLGKPRGRYVTLDLSPLQKNADDVLERFLQGNLEAVDGDFAAEGGCGGCGGGCASGGCAGCSGCGGGAEREPYVETRTFTDIVTLTSENFQTEVLDDPGLILIDFWAEWCQPCRMLAPAFEELNREEPQVKFCRVNVDEQGELAQMFGIESIPTLAVVQDRHTLTGSVGLRSKEEIKAMLDGCK